MVREAGPAELNHERRFGKEYLARGRLGQGAFRVLVTDAYTRRCAVTGEKTLPVLEAAHIKPYALQGPNQVSNGILLRSDLHKLFDLGYVTVTTDLRLEVSPRLKGEWQNGREYYSYHGQPLAVQPSDPANRPAAEYLRAPPPLPSDDGCLRNPSRSSDHDAAPLVVNCARLLPVESPSGQRVPGVTLTFQLSGPGEWVLGMGCGLGGLAVWTGCRAGRLSLARWMSYRMSTSGSTSPVDGQRTCSQKGKALTGSAFSANRRTSEVLPW